MNLRILIILIVLVSCEKDTEIVSFRFINSSSNHIDTLYLNATGASAGTVWPIIIEDLPIKDTTESIQFKSASEPLYAKLISGSESFTAHILSGNYYPTEPSSFIPGHYFVHISHLDVT